MTSHDPDFWQKAADVCGLYLNPPENAVVWSVDEKSGIQAKSRINPTRPAVPGIARRQEFEYRRNGTAVLFAGLNVHDGDVAGWFTDSTRSDNFVEFLGDLDAQTPSGMELHCIVNNFSAHFTPAGRDLLGRAPADLLARHADPCLMAEPGGAVLLHPRASPAAQRRVRRDRTPIVGPPDLSP